MEKNDCINAEIELKRSQKWKKEKKIRKEALKTKSDYLKEAQKWFNK